MKENLEPSLASTEKEASKLSMSFTRGRGDLPGAWEGMQDCGCHAGVWLAGITMQLLPT